MKTKQIKPPDFLASCWPCRFPSHEVKVCFQLSFCGRVILLSKWSLLHASSPYCYRL